MNRSMPGFPVHHHLPEFTQAYVHQVSDAIQPSHPWSSPFSSCTQSLSTSESFPMSHLFAWGGQSTGASALASFLPKKSQDWSPSEWTGWISLQSKGLSSLLQHHSSKASILQHSFLYSPTLTSIHDYWKMIALTIRTFVSKVMCLLFNILPRFDIAILPSSKCLLISWLQSPSALILEPKKMKSDTVSTFSPSICHEVMGLDGMILVFWRLNFKPIFSLSSFTFIKRLFSSSLLSAIRVVSSAYLRLLIFLPIDIPSQTLESSLCFIQPGILYEAQMVKNPPTVQEIRVQFLGWEDPLEKGMATHRGIVYLLGESHGQRSLAGYSSWVAKSQTWLCD